ncbi:MAG: hypothetical protein ACR2O7_10350 [Parasphingorhabdus sp.]
MLALEIPDGIWPSLQIILFNLKARRAHGATTSLWKGSGVQGSMRRSGLRGVPDKAHGVSLGTRCTQFWFFLTVNPLDSN